MGPRPRAALVDIDGTLVDRDGALLEWLRQRAGLAPALVDHLAILDRRSGRDLAALSRRLWALRPELGPDPHTLEARVRAELPGFITPDPAVIASLDALAEAEVELAVVSNGGGQTQRAKLRAAGIDHTRFRSLSISAEFGVAKPGPAIFRRALAALQVEAGAAIMIGDSPHEDIAGAATLALRSCWISRGAPYPSGAPEPTWRTPDFPGAARVLLAL